MKGKQDKQEVKGTVGVLVGRFQTPELLEGHREVLDRFYATKHDRHVIIIGLSVLKNTYENPLDFNLRRDMIWKEYKKDAEIYYLHDCNGDDVWSEELDAAVEKFAEGRPVTIYGTHETVVSPYKGKHEVVPLEASSCTNWDEYCRAKGREGLDLKAFRWGACWATRQHYPTGYGTVDCAIFEDDTMTQLYLAKKPKEKLWRFVGGFIDPEKDNDINDTAKREAFEETNLECRIVGTSCYKTFKVNDWRYAKEKDKIFTHLYIMVKSGGVKRPKDDVSDVKAFDLTRLPENFRDWIMPEHRMLFDEVMEYRRTHGKA